MTVGFIDIVAATKLLASGIKEAQEHWDYFSPTFLPMLYTKKILKNESNYIHLSIKKVKFLFCILHKYHFADYLTPFGNFLAVYLSQKVHLESFK